MLTRTLLEFLQNIEDSAGPEAREAAARHLFNVYAPNTIAISGFSSFEQEIVQAVSAFENPTTRLGKTEIVLLHKSLSGEAQKLSKMFEAASNISDKDLGLDLTETLSKALLIKDTNKIAKHNDEHPKSDHTHYKSRLLPEDLRELLESPEKYRQGRRNTKHNVYDTKATHVLKPFHEKLGKSEQYKSPRHLGGWSHVATRDLYHAGGCGHLCEDVSVGEHQHIPITAHRIEPEYKSYALQKCDANPTELRKIALMDFLTDNNDRHQGNLYLAKGMGQHDRLQALDHGRSFQYESSAKPGDYLQGNAAMADLCAQTADHGWHGVYEWWQGHSHALKKCMSDNCEAILDDATKAHVLANFGQRWNVINEWANGGMHDQGYGSFTNDVFAPEAPDAIHIPFPQEPGDTANQIIQRVDPENFNQTFDMIANHAANEKHKPQMRSDLEHVLAHMTHNATPEQLAEIYNKSANGQYPANLLILGKTPYFSTLSYLQNEADQGNIKTDHAAKLLAHMEQDPNANPLWAQKLKTLV